MMQNEASQERKLSELAMSAAEQINQRVEKILEPNLELLLTQKGQGKRLKNQTIQKEQHYKLKQTAREQNAKEPQIRDNSVDSGSTLANFAKRHIGVELSGDFSSDENADYDDNKMPGGKGKIQV